MGKKVLLADDSITIQKLVEMAFSDTDFELVAVSDGKQAVEKVEEMEPDIILADAIMPLLDGYQVCDWLKSQPKYAHIPVILLTGRFQPFDQARAEAVKIDERVVKPFVQEELVALIHRLIEGAPTEDHEVAEGDVEEAEEATDFEAVDLEEESPNLEDGEPFFLEEEIEEVESIDEEATRADMEKVDFDNETIRVNPDELKAYLKDMRTPAAMPAPEEDFAVPTAGPEPEDQGDENDFDDSFNRSIESLELDEFEELREAKIPDDESEEMLSLEEAELLDDELEEPVQEEEADERIVMPEEDEDETVRSEPLEESSIDEIDTVSVEPEPIEDVSEEEVEAEAEVKPDPDEDLTAPFPKIDVDTNVVFERQGVPEEPERHDLEDIEQLEFEEESFTEEPITEPSEDETAPDLEKPAELEVAMHSDSGEEEEETLSESDSEPITEPTEPEPPVLEEPEVVAEELELIEDLDQTDLVSDDGESTQERHISKLAGVEGRDEESVDDLVMDEDLILDDSLSVGDEPEDLDLSDPALLDVEDSAPFELGEAELIEDAPLESDVEAPQELEPPRSPEPEDEEPLKIELDSEMPTEELGDVEFLEEFEEAPLAASAAEEEPVMEEVEFDLRHEAVREPEESPEEAVWADQATVPEEEPLEELEIEPEEEEEPISLMEEEAEVEEIPEVESEAFQMELEEAEEIQPPPADSVEIADHETVPELEGPHGERLVLEPEQLDYLVEQVVEKVMARLGDTVGNIAWEVIPELSEAMIKKRIFELEKSAESE